MPDFTPGPWERQPVLNTVLISGHPHRCYPIANPDTGVAICIIPAEDDTPAARAAVEANWFLITEAPAMYEALKVALNLDGWAYTSFAAGLNHSDEREKKLGEKIDAAKEKIQAILARIDGKP